VDGYKEIVFGEHHCLFNGEAARAVAVGVATFGLAIVLPHLCAWDEQAAERAVELSVELGCGDGGGAACEAIGEVRM
jgi:hypothetical protein